MSQKNATQDLLFELGTEELPPKSLRRLSEALGKEISDGLQQAKLNFGEVALYAAPRRLAVWIKAVETQQADQKNLRKGPAEKAAFDADGNPTKALQGFAKSCGVEVDQLEKVETPKGNWMAYQVEKKGEKTADLLPAILQTALDRLPIAKRMRWGASDAEFLRPVHWVVVLLGNETVSANLYGIQSGNFSYGHRFHHPEQVTIAAPDQYESALKNEGKVVASFEERKTTVRAQVEQVAKDLGGNALIDEDLLEEVAALSEWPVALSGSFEEKFLTVPAEALVASMQGHQKFFPVVDGNGKLMAHFITISNIESKNPEMVKHGNERVIRPRLADATFFWEQDRKQSLSAHQDGLKKVVYQDKLGSVWDKSERVAKLAAEIAKQLGSDTEMAQQAGLLAKCDLLTNMVKEFPELQGIMGEYYAKHDNAPEAVSTAIREQYLPRFAGDELPSTPTGEAVALAERIDSLVGIFGIGMIPTGDKDPFALRRAALGVLRILVEKQRDLNLKSLVDAAVAIYGSLLEAGTAEKVFDFVLERLRAYYQDQNISADLFESVYACRPQRPLDFDLRIAAVSQFVKSDAAEPLSAANKRIHNLLKKSAESSEAIPEQINESLFEEEAEKNLAQKLAEIRQQVDQQIEAGNYADALNQLSTLRQPVDDFFEAVMVMSDNADLRKNRLALLTQLRDQFLRIADISVLQSA